ncbi:MAG: P27 family phage terminase small subunit [FCB group bacterium]|nr:P27 family phage terminase small subunit [FCB group bacterium]
MGKRGPQPTPTSILHKRGSWRAALRDGEPEGDGSAPPMPTGLDEAAETEWNRVIGWLEINDLTSSVDMSALAAYCVYWSVWCKLSLKLTGMEDVTTTAYRRLLTCVNDAFNNMLKAAREFGFTPSSRTGLRVGERKQKTDDPLAVYFQAGRKSSG